ncbi:hypothetical protein [Odoribacter laneus]|uniref:hypothetical protein n=1 Tax=Odoribacter laneus TaxID=626933 RepID=UPI003993DE5E
MLAKQVRNLLMQSMYLKGNKTAGRKIYEWKMIDQLLGKCILLISRKEKFIIKYARNKPVLL